WAIVSPIRVKIQVIRGSTLAKTARSPTEKAPERIASAAKRSTIPMPRSIKLRLMLRTTSVSSVSFMAARRRASLKTAKRSEEHTSELQSRENLVCRLLLEKKKKSKYTKHP